MAKRVPETLEVYEPGRDYKDAPNEVVPYEEGRRRVDAGEASWCKHNRGIRMHRPQPISKSRSGLKAGSIECHETSVATMRKLVTVWGAD